MTITTDRPSGAVARSRSAAAGSRSTVVERRRRPHPMLTPYADGPCLPVLDRDYTVAEDREAIDQDYDATSAHFADQYVGVRAMIGWALVVVIATLGLLGVANLRAGSDGAGVQPAGVVEVHNGAVIEYTPDATER